MSKHIEKKQKKRKKTILRIALAAAAILLAACLGLGAFLFNYTIARKPELSNEIDPDAPSLSDVFAQSRIDGRLWLDEHHAEILHQTTDDGVDLVGYYVPAVLPSQKTAVLVHGHRTNATMMGYYGDFFHEEGFNVFMADNRGHGASGGDYVGMGWLDRLDYLGWLDLLMEKAGPETEFVLHGVSMGGSAVLMMSGEAALPGNVKAIIADCGYTSAYDEFNYHVKSLHLPSFPIMNIANAATQLLAGYSYREASSVEQVKKAQVPIFIIHGAEDSYNPTFMAYEIYDAIPGEKDLWIVPGAEHGVSYFVDQDEYTGRMKAFYEKYLTD